MPYPGPPHIGNNFSFIPPVSSIVPHSMSASTTKDHYTIIGIHPVPAHLSTKEFAANLEALADVLLARPIAQSNVLKWHMVPHTNYPSRFTQPHSRGPQILPNDQQASPFKAAGFPELQPVVVVQVECEVQYALSVYMHALSRRSSSPDPRTLHAGVCCIYRRRCGPDGFQCLSDEAVAKSFSTAPEFTATTVFGTDMVTDIDTPASEGDITRINIYRCPPNLSTAEFYKRMREFLQEFGALPVVQKHMLKYARVCCPFLHYSPTSRPRCSGSRTVAWRRICRRWECPL
jgi:hypothetical protein